MRKGIVFAKRQASCIDKRGSTAIPPYSTKMMKLRLLLMLWLREKLFHGWGTVPEANQEIVKDGLIFSGLKKTKKTLILDLDETLVHSVTIGSTMRSGHVVEVKLENQHAILYYVHKRPYCHWFLTEVAEYFSLVLFTASVQQYADPVINCIEEEKPIFERKLYRQDCINEGGAYVKDIGKVEKSLSNVLIIDNSPMSYCLHKENAIPIEGWLNDPTDIDLLSLVPVLRAVSTIHDVRSFVVMRDGEKSY
ncbi:hypothetical protein BJ508DRAFT_106331 [Ascobolus immersus RN42]|uniref:FCP1 homology domain-containing protein n=1 Tax=Ascobolus immersus RN42 TaxID=1160509 RepID=A0A3N4I8L9_ASCIM|nr:hypothetical protein BJ508DRAFT_106331 [Ascobolus immersus RN42]